MKFSISRIYTQYKMKAFREKYIYATGALKYRRKTSQRNRLVDHVSIRTYALSKTTKPFRLNPIRAQFARSFGILCMSALRFSSLIFHQLVST